MVWALPPGRAGRAPQASRHSNSAEVVLGAGGRDVLGSGGGLVVRLAPLAVVAAGFGVDGGRGAVADAETEFICALLEQALTIDAKLMLPASRSSRRRLTSSGQSSGRPDGNMSITDTIRSSVVNRGY